MTVKRIKSNKWEVRVSIGHGKQRKQLKRIFYGSREEAKRYEAKLLIQHGNTRAINTAQSLHEYAFTTWLPVIEVASITRETYARHMKSICNKLGHVPLKELKPQMLEAYFANASTPSVARKQFETLRTALNTAVRWNLLESNPCSRMQAPRKPRKSAPEVYSPQEVQSIMQAIRGQWFEPLWLLGVFCGLRVQEACAVDVPPRDWDGVLMIDKTYSYQGVDEGWKLSPTKTEASHDFVHVPKPIVERILEITEGRTGAITQSPGARVHKYPTGKSYHAAYQAWCEREGIRMIPPKNLRHTAATLMLQGGVDLASVSRVLRHTQVSTTANAYLGVIEGAKKQASEQLFNHIME